MLRDGSPVSLFEETTEPTTREIQLIHHMRARQGNEAPEESLALSADWLRYMLTTGGDASGVFKEKWHFVESIDGGHWNVVWPDGAITIMREADDPKTHQRIACWSAHV